MPAVLGEHDAIGPIQVEVREELACPNEGCAIDLLTPLVQLLEVPSERVRLMLVIREQELDAADSVPETAHCVESRRENETDASRGHGLVGEASGANERAQPHVLRLVEHLQTISGEHAVL